MGSFDEGYALIPNDHHAVTTLVNLLAQRKAPERTDSMAYTVGSSLTNNISALLSALPSTGSQVVLGISSSFINRSDNPRKPSRVGLMSSTCITAPSPGHCATVHIPCVVRADFNSTTEVAGPHPRRHQRGAGGWQQRNRRLLRGRRAPRVGRGKLPLARHALWRCIALVQAAAGQPITAAHRGGACCDLIVVVPCKHQVCPQLYRQPVLLDTPTTQVTSQSWSPVPFAKGDPVPQWITTGIFKGYRQFWQHRGDLLYLCLSLVANLDYHIWPTCDAGEVHRLMNLIHHVTGIRLKVRFADDVHKIKTTRARRWFHIFRTIHIRCVLLVTKSLSSPITQRTHAVQAVQQRHLCCRGAVCSFFPGEPQQPLQRPGELSAQAAQHGPFMIDTHIVLLVDWCVITAVMRSVHDQMSVVSVGSGRCMDALLRSDACGSCSSAMPKPLWLL